MSDPHDEWPCLQDMQGAWHVRTEARHSVKLGDIASGNLMRTVMDYFKESAFA